MKRTLLLALALACLFACVPQAGAQEPKPTITIVMSSQKAVMDNIQSVMVGLAQSPNEFTTLKDMIEVLLLGSDPTRGVSYRGYLVGKELRDVYSIPVSDSRKLKDFLTNISDLGYRTRKDPSAGRGEELYRMSNLDTGSVRYDATTRTLQIVPLGNSKNTALQTASRTLARAITSQAPASLLGGRDILAMIENSSGDLADRKAAFATVMANVNTAIEKKLEKETAAEHALRVAAARQQMAELERFFVESARIVLGSTTVIKDGTSRLDIELRPLPDTELAKSVALLGKSPDEFGGVPLEGAVTFSNVNFAIDPLRKQNLLDLAKLWRPALNERIDSRTDLSAESKQAEKDLAELTTQVVTEVAELGTFNNFLRVYQKGEEYTTVSATRVPNGDKFLDLLKSMEGHKGTAVKLDIEKGGDVVSGNGGAAVMSSVAIHTIALPHAAKEFPAHFGDDGVMYIGTSAGSIWYAHGQDALATLKQAIQDATAAGPKTSPLLVNSSVALLPWLETWDRRQGKKDGIGIRKAAIEGLKAGKDQFTIKLWLDEKDPTIVRVQAVGYEGILRAAGKITSKVVREKLE